MKVTLTVGSVTRELEVRPDLLDAFPSRASNIYQDAVIGQLGAAFVEAYAEEVRRAKEAASGQPPAGA